MQVKQKRGADGREEKIVIKSEDKQSLGKKSFKNALSLNLTKQFILMHIAARSEALSKAVPLHKVSRCSCRRLVSFSFLRKKLRVNSSNMNANPFFCSLDASSSGKIAGTKMKKAALFCESGEIN